jgi:hypothetical protein
MVCTVIDKGAVKILGNINNDLMAIPGRVEGATVDDRGTDPAGCPNHKGMGTGYIIGREKISGSFMKNKTCHVRGVALGVIKIVIGSSGLTSTYGKGFGKGNGLFGKTGYSGRENLCGSVSLDGGTVPQLSGIILSESME